MQYSSSLENLKKKLGMPREVVDAVEEQLRPWFRDFKTGSPQFLLCSKSAKIIEERSVDITNWLLRQRDLTVVFSAGMEASKLTPDEKATMLTFFMANYYLLLVELLGISVVDKTILLVVGAGVDFHIEPDYQHRYTRHAYSLEDLESPSLSLSVKLDFLCSNGLQLFSRFIDRNLRNKIAHMDFEIDAKGNLLINRKIVDLNGKINCLIQYYVCINELFQEEEKKAGYGAASKSTSQDHSEPR